MKRNHAIAPPLGAYKARHVLLAVEGGIARITLNRPEKKNPLTFESYDELAAIFAAARKDDNVHAFVITGAGGNFCSGGDVFEIIGPLTQMNVPQLLRFTEMTGDLVKAIRQKQKQNPEQAVVIAADKDVRYEAVLEVMDMLQRNQVRKVGLLAKPRGG